MRLVCEFRGIRESEGKTLADIAAASGLSKQALSMIERGVALPSDDQVLGLEAAYGRPIEDIYSRLALLAIQEDEPNRVLVSLPKAHA